MSVWGAIEGGGTKFVCAVGTGPQDYTERQFPTTTPDETIRHVIDFLKQREPFAGIGIGSFGPVDLKQGKISSTPKSGWRNFDFVGAIRSAFPVPIAFDTDVNAAAFGEAKWGVGAGVDSLIYITVGTGIGGGAMVDGRLVHGLLHPEMGHIRVPHDWRADPFLGVCPYHGDCLEGLASGPALQRRGEFSWDLIADYLAYGVNNYVCTLSPEMVVLGGGVMRQPGLLAKVQERVGKLLNNYIDRPQLTEKIASYLVAPGLGDHAGVLGALALAQTVAPPAHS